MLVALTSCQPDPLYRQEAYVFGTRVEVQIYGASSQSAQQAAAAIFADFDRLHSTYHAWQPSALTSFNQALAAGKHVAATEELSAILRETSTFSRQSHNLFNPAIGQLIALWGFQQDAPAMRLPDPEMVRKLTRAQAQMSDLHQDQQGRWYSSNPQLKLDFGGYLKGYALDQGAGILRDRGIHNALLNIGGNVMALGRHGERAWRVALQHPRLPTPLATLELHDGEALGTSGDYQRYFEFQGRRYSHLIDPRHGAPSQGSEAVSVLVDTQGFADRTGTWSDMASKPLFIGGTQWNCLAQELRLRNVLKVDDQGQVLVAEPLFRRLAFNNPDVRPIVFSWPVPCSAAHDDADFVKMPASHQ